MLDKGYSDPVRGYHSWAHIDDLVGKLDVFSDLAVRPDLIMHAILWHDVVYKTQDQQGKYRPDSLSVQESADLFMKHSLMSETDKQAIYAMIMATASHMNPQSVPEFYPGFYKDRDLFLDLDLNSLAADPETFDKNTQDIWYEFSWMNQKEFFIGRAGILEKFAEAKPTYKTPKLEILWGEKARSNLVRSAGLLKQSAHEIA